MICHVERRQRPLKKLHDKQRRQDFKLNRC